MLGYDLKSNLKEARAGLSGQGAAEQRLERVLGQILKKRLKHQQVTFCVHFELNIGHYPLSDPALGWVLCQVNLYGGWVSMTKD